MINKKFLFTFVFIFTFIAYIALIVLLSFLNDYKKKYIANKKKEIEIQQYRRNEYNVMLSEWKDNSSLAKMLKTHKQIVFFPNVMKIKKKKYWLYQSASLLK